MTYRIALILSSAALLGACATAQENPNYKFSSKYNPGTQVTQVASVPAPEVTVAVYEPMESTDYVVVQPDYPAQVATTSVGPAVSATEEVFDASTMDGTPGYQIFVEDTATPFGAPIGAPSESPVLGRGTPVNYDYSQNIIVAGADVEMMPSETRRLGNVQLGMERYTVVPGDTVYSLSRARCVGINDVTAPNGIGSDFAISIGQQITLPRSRC